MENPKYIIKIFALLLGFTMNAQPTETKDMAKDGIIAIYDTPLLEMLYVGQNGKICTDDKKIGIGPRSSEHKEYTHMDKRHRKLMPHQAEEYSAMDKIKIRRGKLYFDGRRVKTNKWYLSTYYVKAAYYWNGGVLLVGETTNYLGFINLSTYKCKISLMNWLSLASVSFLSPVSTVNMANSDFVFDVQIPETVSMGEMVDLVVTLTNVSDRPLPAPEFLFGGMGIYFRYYTSSPDHDDKETLFEPELRFKAVRDPRPLRNKASLLGPSKSRSNVHASLGRAFGPNPGRNRVRFVWEGFLDEDDPNVMTRFECVRWVEVKPMRIATSSDLFAFDVDIPQSVSRKDRLNISLSLTNMTNRTLPAPQYLISGFDVLSFYEVFDESGNKISDIPDDRLSLIHPGSGQATNNNQRAPMGPYEKRVSSGSTSPASRFISDTPGRYRIVFTLQSFLNPDDWDELTRLSVEKWVEVTK